MGVDTPSSQSELPRKGDIVAGGKYRIDRLVGQGGMGVVFVGIHTTLGTQVAIKWMLPKFSSDRTAVQRFLREATIAAKIRHPNVVQPIDVSDDPSKPFIIMELLEGQSLAKFVGEGRLSPMEIGRIFIPILEAVSAAHQHKVIHRDLKLDNVFLSDAGSGGIIPKVLDFGIAKLADKGTVATITQDHSVLGTVQYMSPEQILHPSDVTEQTDVYALGVILYRLLTGTFPHQAENILDLALRIRDTDPIPLSKHLSNVPPGLESALARALSKSTTQRFPDVMSFREAVVPFIGRTQEWMKTCEVKSVGGLKSANRTSFAIPSTNSPEADCSIPSSLHSLELESFRPPRKKNTNLWVPLLFVVLVALVGTFVWLKFERSATKTYANQPPIDRKHLDEKIQSSIRKTPPLPNTPSQPELKRDENEWPSLSKIEEEQRVEEERTEPSVPVTTKGPVQPPQVSPPPAPLPTQSVDPTERRKITYKRYSGSSTHSTKLRQSPSRIIRTKAPSKVATPSSVEESPKSKGRTGDLLLEDF